MSNEDFQSFAGMLIGICKINGEKSQSLADKISKQITNGETKEIPYERPQELCDLMREYITGGETAVNGVLLSMMPRVHSKYFPENFQEIAKEIGIDKTLWLISQWPAEKEKDKRYPNSSTKRVRIYVPSKDELKTSHRLVKILGWDNAVKMADKFCGKWLRLSANCEPKGQLSVRDHSIMCVAGEGRLIDSTGKDWLAGVKSKVDRVEIIAEYFKVSESHVKKLITKFKRGEID